jgi:hypothetical protein
VCEGHDVGRAYAGDHWNPEKKNMLAASTRQKLNGYRLSQATFMLNLQGVSGLVDAQGRVPKKQKTAHRRMWVHFQISG